MSALVCWSGTFEEEVIIKDVEEVEGCTKRVGSPVSITGSKILEL